MQRNLILILALAYSVFAVFDESSFLEGYHHHACQEEVSFSTLQANDATPLPGCHHHRIVRSIAKDVRHHLVGIIMPPAGLSIVAGANFVDHPVLRSSQDLLSLHCVMRI